MNDYIKREDARQAIISLHGGCITDAVKDFIDYTLLSVPTADVVEVVRCKECIYNDRGWCGAQESGTRYIEDDDYCSFGERKDDEQVDTFDTSDANNGDV